MTEQTFKMILVGDSFVGKTSIINRFINAQYSADYKSTIGSDISQKEVVVDGLLYSLSIWDTAGHEKYQSVIKSFYRGTDFCLLVYDVTNKDSFLNLYKWWNEYKEEDSSRVNDTVVMVIGNKIDSNERIISKEIGNNFAKEHGWLYNETSAFENVGIEETIRELIRTKNPLRNSFVYVDSVKNKNNEIESNIHNHHQ